MQLFAHEGYQVFNLDIPPSNFSMLGSFDKAKFITGSLQVIASGYIAQ
ncbi:MAG: hypothetical protein ACI9YH_000674 [Colwellia sp.]|jgi:hypothetical protein